MEYYFCKIYRGLLSEFPLFLLNLQVQRKTGVNDLFRITSMSIYAMRINVGKEVEKMEHIHFRWERKLIQLL